MTMALLGVSSAQQPFPFSADLKCGMCIKNNYTFCVQATDGQVFGPGEKPVATCCKDSTCAQASDQSYTCSDTYFDQDYGLTMCPQRQNKCGEKQEIELEEGDTETVEVTGLEVGETCTYKIKSNCGSPAFKLQDGATDGLEFTFLEFEDAEAKETGKGKGKNKSPKDGMPSRDQTFEDSDADEEESADGPIEKPDGNQGKGKGATGKPTKGRYDPTIGGYKTFGTDG